MPPITSINHVTQCPPAEAPIPPAEAPPAETGGDLSEKDILKQILDCLKNQRVIEERNRVYAEFNKEKDTFSQLCSVYAVIAVFIASLSAAILSYAHDSFSSRPNASPPKRTDNVVNAFLFISILSAIASAMTLSAGSSSSFLLKLASKSTAWYRRVYELGRNEGIFTLLPESSRRILESSYNTLSRTFPESTLGILSVLWQLSRDEAMILEPPAIQTHAMANANDDTANAVNSIPAVHEETREQDFIMAMIIVSLVFMALSLCSLVVGLMVFIWAEHALGVSIPVSLAVFFSLSLASFIQDIMSKILLVHSNRRTRREGREAQGPVPPV